MKLFKALIIERIDELNRQENKQRFEFLIEGNVSFRPRLERSLRAIHEVREINKTLLAEIMKREEKKITAA